VDSLAEGAKQLTMLKKSLQAIRTRKDLIILILLNFITNYLFIFQYGFYSDDWSLIVYSDFITSSYRYLLLDSQRPIDQVLFKFMAEVIPHQPIWFHLIGFITTSLMLLLVYEIAKKIFHEFGCNGLVYPFVTAVIYCVLFNKDQIYPWAILSNGFGYLTYLLSFYFFLHRKQQWYLIFSLSAYTLGLFTYEIGFALPILFLAYEYLADKKEKAAFIFAVPLTGYLLIKMTRWFGYGHVIFDRGIGNWEIHALLSHSLHIIEAIFYIPLKQLVYATIGLQQLPLWIVGGLIVMNLAVVHFILNRIAPFSSTPWFSPKYLLFTIITTASFTLPYVLRGAIETRGFVFIDIGLALLIVPALLRLPDRSGLHIGLTIIIVASIIICQGLYVNWVMAGNIQRDIDRYIGNNAEKIEQFDYVYLNTTSFAMHRPYKVERDILGPLKDLYYRGLWQDPFKEGDKVQGRISPLSCWNCTYSPYYNVPGLDTWALSSMMRGNLGIPHVPLLLYGQDSVQPVGITDVTITYENISSGGPAITVEKSRIFEIQYCQISGSYHCQ